MNMNIKNSGKRNKKLKDSSPSNTAIDIISSSARPVIVETNPIIEFSPDDVKRLRIAH
jgi:hypothetical protein